MALKDKDSASDEAEAPQTALARGSAFMRENRVLLRRLGVIASVAIIGVSVFIFGRTLVTINFNAIRKRVPRHGGRSDIPGHRPCLHQLSRADRL